MATEMGVGLELTSEDSAALLAEFRTWLERERGLAPESVRTYSKQAKAFLASIGGPEAVGGLDPGQVVTFMVNHFKNGNAGSAKVTGPSLRAFLRFAHARGRTASLLVEAVPAVASWRLAGLPRDLSAADIELLLGGCDRESPVGTRDYAILSLLSRLGLRGAEVASLQIGDVHWHSGDIMITGKGSSIELLPLPGPVGEALVAWLTESRPRCESRALFVTMVRPHRRLSPGSVRSIMGRACGRAGIERCGPHRLRHALATEMLRAGASLPEVGQVLRHHSQESTSIYAKVDQASLLPIARRWPGVGA